MPQWDSESIPVSLDLESSPFLSEPSCLSSTSAPHPPGCWWALAFPGAVCPLIQGTISSELIMGFLDPLFHHLPLDMLQFCVHQANVPAAEVKCHITKTTPLFLVSADRQLLTPSLFLDR